ncbi:glycosyltransferase family 4 protein [Candidatus Daviesbacteria bacterium]|nr:glycosyltransferase family 4 protein [Candidatus Daviesbacteria bacterium]
MRSLRIAQIAGIAERVPPHYYGGTERVVYSLTEELVKRGHNVTLFASGNSQTSAKLVAIFPKSLREVRWGNIYGPNILTLLNIGYAYQQQNQFDIIHDHNNYLSLPTANLSQTPVVMTLHGALGVNEKRIFENLQHPFLVTISKAQSKSAPNLNYIGNVYHGLKMNNYPFFQKDGGYLLFVGRISREKGLHLAIEVAQYLDMPLIIAAKLNTTVDAPHDVQYFHEYIEPKLSSQIRWIGEVDEKQRNLLMSNATCLLHPITWPEPFGLTVIEAMACGCPVVTFNLGSMPEIIENGKTGFIVDGIDGMVGAVANIKKIQRRVCREYVLERFTVEKMTDGYEKIYQQVLEKQEKGYRFSKPSRPPYLSHK